MTATPAMDESGHGHTHGPIHRHRDVTGGWLRPAVFGAMDGLVSNFALIAGVAGGTGLAAGGSDTVVLAGLAGLAAGAFSMAAGEYTSVASQSELAQAEIEIERREIARSPLEEQEELARMYAARGLDLELARTVAAVLSRNPEQALAIHVREELGLDPDDLPSPSLAAVSSFAAFALGASVPLIPFLFAASTLWPALIVTLVALFALGAAVGQMTSSSWWYSGSRQLLLGAAAAGITYGVGSGVGAALG